MRLLGELVLAGVVLTLTVFAVAVVYIDEFLDWAEHDDDE